MTNDATTDPEVRRLLADRLAAASLDEARRQLATGNLARAAQLVALTEGFVKVRDRSDPRSRSRRAPVNWAKLNATRTRP